MRTLNYKLENGTIVKTMREAKASGQRYSVTLETVDNASKEFYQNRKRRTLA